MKKVTHQEAYAECGQIVKLQTTNGIIEGSKTLNHTGNQTNLVEVAFEYNGMKYKYPFSRKTGKLYACKLPFEIKMML